MNKQESGGSLRNQIQNLRTKLRSKDPSKIAEESGVTYFEDKFQLTMLGRQYTINLPDFNICSSSAEPEAKTKLLLLNYLTRARNFESSGEWLGFQQIPDGGFYSSAFKDYTENRLTERFQGRIEVFKKKSIHLNGTPIQLGDAGFSFQAFPKFKLALVFWDGGDEFPDKITLLFEDSSILFLSTEGLAILGRMLSDKFLDEEIPKDL